MNGVDYKSAAASQVRKDQKQYSKHSWNEAMKLLVGRVVRSLHDDIGVRTKT